MYTLTVGSDVPTPWLASLFKGRRLAEEIGITPISRPPLSEGYSTIYTIHGTDGTFEQAYPRETVGYPLWQLCSIV